jgi:pyruvate kinase
MFVIDYPNIHKKLDIGDKVLVDYGGVVLTVIGFDNEDKYIRSKKRPHKHLH